LEYDTKKAVSSPYSTGYIRLAAKRADRAVVNRRAAIRATARKHFAAYGAIPAARRICRRPVRTVQKPAIHFIASIRRTMRIAAKAGMGRKHQGTRADRNGIAAGC